MTTQDQVTDMGAIEERTHKVRTSGGYARIGNPTVGDMLCGAEICDR